MKTVILDLFWGENFQKSLIFTKCLINSKRKPGDCGQQAQGLSISMVENWVQPRAVDSSRKVCPSAWLKIGFSPGLWTASARSVHQHGSNLVVCPCAAGAHQGTGERCASVHQGC